MRTYVVPYRIVFGQAHLLPLCEIDLIGRSGRVPILALVDTGAEISVFPRKAAEDAELSLPPAPNDRVRFGGSLAPAWRLRAVLEMNEERWAADVFFVERIEFPYALLGRRGVFARFKEVSFVERTAEPRVEFRG